MTLATTKSALRRHYASIRDSLSPAHVRAASRVLCERLAAWDPVHDASTVLAYIAFRNEIDLQPLFAALPRVRWAVPRIEGARLILHPYDPARLVRHRFGMLEPASDLPEIPPDVLDIVLVPGVAFDRQGRRLGFGGGYYDRFLPTTPALRVGIAHDECLTECLPHDAHDQNVDWVATPSCLIRCPPHRAVREGGRP